MNREEILGFNNKIVSEAQYDEIELSPCVKRIDCLGGSGYYIGCAWYSVEMEGGSSVNIYLAAFLGGGKTNDI